MRTAFSMLVVIKKFFMAEMLKPRFVKDRSDAAEESLKMNDDRHACRRPEREREREGEREIEREQGGRERDRERAGRERERRRGTETRLGHD